MWGFFVQLRNNLKSQVREVLHPNDEVRSVGNEK